MLYKCSIHTYKFQFLPHPIVHTVFRCFLRRVLWKLFHCLLKTRPSMTWPPYHLWALLPTKTSYYYITDVDILLPVQFSWIIFSSFIGEVENVSANQRQWRPSWFSHWPEKLKFGKGCWYLASCQVMLNSVQRFHRKSRKCLSQSEARVAILVSFSSGALKVWYMYKLKGLVIKNTPLSLTRFLRNSGSISEECMCHLRNVAMRDYQESVITRQTHRRTDARTKWSLCVAMLCRQHKTSVPPNACVASKSKAWQTDGQTDMGMDGGQTKWSLCWALLCWCHKNNTTLTPTPPNCRSSGWLPNKYVVYG